MTPSSAVSRCNPGEPQGGPEKGFLQGSPLFIIVSLPSPRFLEIESPVYLRRIIIGGGENLPVSHKLAILVQFFHEDLKPIPFAGVVVKIDLPCKDIGEGKGQVVSFPRPLNSVEEGGLH